MQVDNKSLVKYDNPVLVSTTKDKKSTLKKVRTTPCFFDLGRAGRSRGGML